MRLIDEHNAAAYLREQKLLGATEAVQIRELPGGVSNAVLHVERTEGDDFVLKQAREQLRVAEPWFCSVERIWREVAVLEVCDRILQLRPIGGVTATTPRVLYADRENFLYTMTAVPAHETWKQQLLRGDLDAAKAQACGELLGRLHAGTWNGANLSEELNDRQFFEDLRIDPYYRHVARNTPGLEAPINKLIESVYDNRLSLVHGDFSPKNLLVHEGGIVLIDFEVGHFGDPAFDLGFFLTHLILKAFNASPAHESYLNLAEQFWASYERPVRVVASDEAYRALCHRAVDDLAGCMLARIVGKSTVEYLSDDGHQSVRQLAREMLLSPPNDIPAAVSRARSALEN
ncbi:MAG: phosphotransferase [Planctomycetaceae bacterium]|nr:phosphotransferase [Planctomycetaceae bacterium]